MNRNEQIAYCSNCKNRSFDRKDGLVCGLSMSIPQLETSCPDFILDNKVIEKSTPLLDVEQDRKSGTKDIIIGAVILVIGIVLTASDLGRIFYGAIMVGAFKIIFGIIDASK